MTTEYGPDVRPFVVGAALASLDSTGRFTFPPSPIDRRLETPADEVRALAVSFLQTFVASPDQGAIAFPGSPFVSLRAKLEDMHGREVDWSRVRAGTRVLLIESHLDQLPPFAPTRRAFGGYYAIPFYAGGIQTATVGVSRFSANVVLVGGKLQFSESDMKGGEFAAGGVPWSWNQGYPMSPELAVQFVSLETGAKVRERPLLARAGNYFAPLIYRWILVLDREVLFESAATGAAVSSSVVHVSSVPLAPGAEAQPWDRTRLFVAAEDQPTVERLVYPGPDGASIIFDAPIRPSMPVRLIEVTLGRRR